MFIPRFIFGLLFRRVHKIAKGDYYLRHIRLSVSPSVRMEHLDSHRTHIHGIWHSIR